MKIGQKYHGFTLLEKSDIKSISATLHLFSHDSGARLLYLAEDYDCKTFGITFGTVPEDDTGVFHILEHAVLCGSERFPTKEPFTELLKGSLNSYLNAFTYNDKTCYPVSSRNDKDFLNLIDVYMDAVFNPLATKNEKIFRQEGWRYEVSDEGVAYNGVVYSEMCGAYSSPDELAAYHNGRLMYPGGTYSLDAGGNPDAIPNLTYSDFVAMHERFYTPENAYILLHGKIDTDAVLPLIASYLDAHSPRPFEYKIERGGEPVTTPHTVYFDSEGEDTKCRVYITYPTFEIENTEKLIALNTLITAITDSNDAPLKRELLASGIFENVYISATPSALYNTLGFEFHGVSECDVERVAEILDNTLDWLISEGIDESLISATVDQQEFKLREADFGSCPKGIVYLMTLNDAWPYGIHPREVLDFEPQLAFLREKLNTGYYLSLLSEVLAGKRTTLILKPSTTSADERRLNTEKNIKERISLMGEGALDELRRFGEEFAAWQATPDTKEALATIPTLSLSDISTEPREIITEREEIDGATALYHKISTNGITYAEMHFDASDLTERELSLLSLMARTWRDLDTERGSANDFINRSKRTLGAITTTTNHAKREDEARCYLTFSFSFLDRNRSDALELVQEYILEKKLDDTKKISRRTSQTVLAMRDAIIESGHVYASGRTSAANAVTYAAREYTHGIEMYLSAKAIAEEGDFEGARDIFSSLFAKIVNKERLTVAVTGTDAEGTARALVAMLVHGVASAPLSISTLPKRREGIIIPGDVSYAARGSNLFSVTDRREGAWSTLSSILNFEILWNEIRLAGGAYGVGFASRGNSGVLTFRSYRDPLPLRSIDVFKTTGERIRAFVNGDPDLTKFIIGTVGAAIPLTTPAQDAENATLLYLSGKSHKDNVINLKEIVATTKDDLIRLSYLLDEADESAASAIVGPRSVVTAFTPDNVIEI